MGKRSFSFAVGSFDFADRFALRIGPLRSG
jgi:hypothetical protein